MLYRNRLRGIVLTLILLIGFVGCDSLPFISDDEAGISASGVVETVEVAIAPEIGGRVVEIYVAEGDAVEEGEPLFRLDEELLASQRQLAVTSLEAAESNLSTARTGLEMAKANLRTAEASVDTVTANAEVELLAAQKALEDLNKSHGVTLSEAYRNLADANRAVREAQYRLDNFTVPTNQRDMTAIEAISEMKIRLDVARAAFEPYRYKDSGDATRKDFKEDLDDAQSDYDAAIRRLEYETALESALAALELATTDLETLQAGPDPNDVAVLNARIAAAESAPKQAQASVEQAEVGLSQAQAQLEQAEKAVAQSQATLDLIDTQMKRITVNAPVSGVVLVRNIEQGAVLQPGATAMTLGELESLTITVFVPEDKYGQITVGDSATVSVDSFPGEAFNATVVRIADKAEYTPRNTQTQEERVTTVFAIKLQVDDPDQKLKPGMPADVEFSG